MKENKVLLFADRVFSAALKDVVESWGCKVSFLDNVPKNVCSDDSQVIIIDSEIEFESFRNKIICSPGCNMKFVFPSVEKEEISDKHSWRTMEFILIPFSMIALFEVLRILVMS